MSIGVIIHTFYPVNSEGTVLILHYPVKGSYVYKCAGDVNATLWHVFLLFLVALLYRLERCWVDGNEAELNMATQS